MSETSYVKIQYQVFSMNISDMVDIAAWVEDDKVHYSAKFLDSRMSDSVQNGTSDIAVAEFIKRAEALDIPGWKKRYEPEDVFVLDGSNWTVKYETEDIHVKSEGEEAFPENWGRFIELLHSVASKF